MPGSEYFRGLAVQTGIIAMVLAPSFAQAGGFQLNERSAQALGAGLAGATSGRGDVTFMGFNPAALTRVEHMEGGFNLSFVSPRAEGKDSVIGAEADPSKGAYVPAGAFGYRVTPEFVVGFTNYSPFGLVTKYDSDFIGQADGLTSSLRTISFSPTVAYTPFDNIHLGAAFNVLYADARLTSTATRLDADDFAFGFSLGGHFMPAPGTTLGLAYHHGYDIAMSGEQEIAAGFGALSGGQVEFPLTASAELPASIQVGITQEITEDVRLMLEGRYILWSAFDRIDFSSTGAPDATAFGGVNFANFADEQNYDDAFFISGGAEYDVSDMLTVRGGLAFDQSPTNDEFRTVRVPDGDRLWVSAGATFNISESTSVDFAYNYLNVIDDPIVTLRNGPVAGETITYNSSVHVFSIGSTFRF